MQFEVEKTSALSRCEGNVVFTEIYHFRIISSNWYIQMQIVLGHSKSNNHSTILIVYQHNLVDSFYIIQLSFYSIYVVLNLAWKQKFLFVINEKTLKNIQSANPRNLQIGINIILVHITYVIWIERKLTFNRSLFHLILAWARS
jgi:hypothetical protein